MTDANDGPGASDAAARQARALDRIAALLRVTAIAAAIVLLVATLGEVVMIVFAAVLAAVLLRGAATRIGRLAGIGTGWGLLVVVLLLLAFFGGLAWWRGPAFVHQAALLQDAVGDQLTALRAQMQQSAWGRGLLQQLPFGLGAGGASAHANAGRVEAVLPHVAGVVAGALWSVLGLVGTSVVVLAAALYMALSPEPYVHGVAHLLPKAQRPEARRVLGHVGGALWGWLLGQFLDMLVVGAAIFAGLWLLGTPLAFILAVIAALTNFVPYIGAVAGAVPAVLVALSVSPQEALYVALLYLGVQTVEGNVSAPLIQRHTIDLPPALTILSQTTLGVIFGVPGVVFATPFTAAVIATVQALERENPEF